MQPFGLGIVASIALFTAACSKDDGFSDQQRLCIAQKFPTYDAKNMEQCLSVCKACLGGNTVTCSTSCKLKGET